MGDAICKPSSQAVHMTKPQIPSHWNPSCYAVDEAEKVVWHQGSHAFAMGLNNGRYKTLIPGYTIHLCRREELQVIREQVAAKAERTRERMALIKYLVFGVLFYACLIGGATFKHWYECRHAPLDQLSLGELERCVSRWGPNNP